MSEKNGLVKNASFLMMATLISRVIGLLYRSPLGVVLGTVGLGYYGYANNVYVIGDAMGVVEEEALKDAGIELGA